jgi:hypothetical protein
MKLVKYQTDTKLEDLIRSGNLAAAIKQFTVVSSASKNLERKDKLKYANFARRLGLADQGLKILNPIMRPTSRFAKPATVEEQIEYAACLRTEGAPREAFAILEKVDLQKFPGARFQMASCMISEWRYGEAIPYLKAYVFESPLATYSTLVGKVNLLAALIYESHYAEAEKLAVELSGELDVTEHGLLYRNVLELRAQLAIAQNDSSTALIYLQEASTLANQAPESVYSLQVSKWIAIARSLRTNEALVDLHDVRTRAIAMRHREIVRDCDFYIAKLQNDRDRLVHIYFGTPYLSLRKKIIETLGSPDQIPQEYLWTDGGTCDRVFDLRNARMSDGGAGLDVGKALHRFLIQMCSDFYRPKQLLSLFAGIFQGEHFSLSAANRVHQVNRRFKLWLQGNHIPLVVEKQMDGYALAFTGRFAISLSKETISLDERDLILTKLRASFLDETFTSREAMNALGVSQPTVHRLMTWAVENGKAVHQGNTHRSRYRLTG